MASFCVEDFIGNGCLKDLLPKLEEYGWDDVPMLKSIHPDDHEDIGMSTKQKNALEIRTYLHDRQLMQYADHLEASEKSLSELLKLSNTELCSQYGIKRGHISRFMDKNSSFVADNVPASYRKSDAFSSRKSGSSRKNEFCLEKSMASFKITEGYVFKGMVASMPAEPRVCGCVKPHPIMGDVAPYSAIENVSLQKLTPEYKIGMKRSIEKKTPPMKASELWRDKPAIFLCIRRPGCVMCRAEAHRLYSKKPIFDALGVQLFAVLHEHIETEVKDFWPGYWGGVVLFNKGQELFKALGGGNLLKENFISGFLLNHRAVANFKRAMAIIAQYNFKGEGEIKGGLFVVGSGKSGIAYQFIERNFGDWAPTPEVIQVCSQFQNPHQYQSDSIKSFKEDEEQ